jgi:hypothetical protein
MTVLENKTNLYTKLYKIAVAYKNDNQKQFCIEFCKFYFCLRRTAWGVQKDRRWPQATHPVGGPPLKRS